VPRQQSAGLDERGRGQGPSRDHRDGAHRRPRSDIGDGDGAPDRATRMDGDELCRRGRKDQPNRKMNQHRMKFADQPHLCLPLHPPIGVRRSRAYRPGLPPKYSRGTGGARRVAGDARNIHRVMRVHSREGSGIMTDARYEKLQQTLDARLCELERELDLKLRAVRANNGYSGEMRAGLDTAETADADLQQDIGIAVLEIKVAALRGARDALARLASGAYGHCAECGGEISEKRLKAFPFAVRCRECEDVYEIIERRSRQALRRLGNLLAAGPVGSVRAGAGPAARGPLL